ncbi:MAG: hemerythrin family protein [Deltaproteobacteria bacterium]|nr:hemerythrin family protein [Deltaproteobacteria bacterium]
MAFFEWKNDYSVGIAKIDDQHKVLVGFLNELFESMQAGKGKNALDSVLTNLVQYTKTHFASEESLMKLYKYPDYEAHKQKHDNMTGHVLELKRQLDSGQISNPIQITSFLKDWLSKHIMGTDKLYGPFLNAKGVR